MAKKKIKTRLGNDGYDYPYTSTDLVKDNEGKSVTTKFEKVNEQYNTISEVRLDNKSIKCLTQSEYDALTTKDENTIYIITDKESDSFAPTDSQIETAVNNYLAENPIEDYDDTEIRNDINTISEVRLDNKSIKCLTQSEYDALTTKDENTIYIITDKEPTNSGNNNLEFKILSAEDAVIGE